MNQFGRNLIDAGDGLLNGKSYLNHDRDPLFKAEFLSLVAGAGFELSILQSGLLLDYPAGN